MGCCWLSAGVGDVEVLCCDGKGDKKRVTEIKKNKRLFPQKIIKAYIQVPAGPHPRRPNRGTWYWPSRLWRRVQTETSEPRQYRDVNKKHCYPYLTPTTTHFSIVYCKTCKCRNRTWYSPVPGCQSCTYGGPIYSWLAHNQTCWWCFWHQDPSSRRTCL